MRKLSEIEADDAVTLPNVVMRAQAWVDRRDLVSALREAMEILDHAYETLSEADGMGVVCMRYNALRGRVEP